MLSNQGTLLAMILKAKVIASIAWQFHSPVIASEAWQSPKKYLHSHNDIISLYEIATLRSQ